MLNVLHIRSFRLMVVSILIFSDFLCSRMANAQSPVQWSEKMANTAMSLWKDPRLTGKASFPKWSYDEGVLLKGIEGLWELTGKGKYFSYIQHSIDYFVDDDGNISTYHPESYKLDDINNGKTLLLLYRVTGKKKYWKAATTLRNQLKAQPRTPDGGFWHKQIYPDQMWLDGLYMAEPFYAEYALLAHEGSSSFRDITCQFILMNRHARDPKTGLLYHGWDASKRQKWANPVSGDSPVFWDRAVGWYAMALVDALDFLPQGFLTKQGVVRQDPYRDSLIEILNKLAAAIAKYQDPVSGCWYQVMDQRDKAGNFLEASGSCMFVYALAKGVRKGYLPEKYLRVAEKGFKGIIKRFVTVSKNGQVNLDGTCPVAGLGGKPYRDGSYQYYIHQKPVRNDPKGIGAFLLAADAMSIAKRQTEGKGITVMLDNYFNHELKKDITGKEIPYHYTWDDMENSGFSLWGNIFRYRGAKTRMLEEAPDSRNLQEASIYIIADPDTKAESSQPKYIESGDIRVLDKWVRSGGVLVLMANDSGNCEFSHFNQLAESFGFHFNEDSKNHVQGHHFEQGALYITHNNPVFKNEKEVYIKELSTLHVPTAFIPVLWTRSHEVVAAIASIGKGSVFVVGDPWFYNEYTDGRKLPGEYENYQAACDLTDWLIGKAEKRKSNEKIN